MGLIKVSGTVMSL